MKIYEINNNQLFNFSCIYLWKNLVNGKLYVGQTQNFYQRMMCYAKGKENKRLIGKAIAKYGIDNFDISILEKDVPLYELDKREQYWMDYYKSYDSEIGYNICSEAGTTRGFRHSEETKKMMSEKKIEFLKNHPENIKYGEENPNFGKHPSDETRQKMSEKLIGNQRAKGKHWTLCEEYRINRSLHMLGKKPCLGRKLSKETREKISESNRNRTISEESKQKMSKSHMGKTCKKVICVETGIIYNSIGEASASIGKDSAAVSHCCRGKQKTAGGFHWEYYVDE